MGNRNQPILDFVDLVEAFTGTGTDLTEEQVVKNKASALATSQTDINTQEDSSGTVGNIESQPKNETQSIIDKGATSSTTNTSTASNFRKDSVTNQQTSQDSVSDIISQATKGGRQTSFLDIDKAGVDKIIGDILGGESGLADIFSQEGSAGLFNSSVAAQASGDLVANVAGEIAKLTARQITEDESTESASQRGTESVKGLNVTNVAETGSEVSTTKSTTDATSSNERDITSSLEQDSVSDQIFTETKAKTEDQSQTQAQAKESRTDTKTDQETEDEGFFDNVSDFIKGIGI